MSSSPPTTTTSTTTTRRTSSRLASAAATSSSTPSPPPPQEAWKRFPQHDTVRGEHEEPTVVRTAKRKPSNSRTVGEHEPVTSSSSSPSVIVPSPLPWDELNKTSSSTPSPTTTTTTASRSKRPKTTTTTTTESTTTTKPQSKRAPSPITATTTTSTTRTKRRKNIYPPAPLSIDLLTGSPMTVPEGWCSDLGGELAGKYAQALHSGQLTRAPPQSYNYFRCFRLLGSTTHEITFPNSRIAHKFWTRVQNDTDVLKSKLANAGPEATNDIPWTKQGDPLKGGAAGDAIMVRIILTALQSIQKDLRRGEDDEEEEEDQATNSPINTLIYWCRIAAQLQEPGGSWKCPLIFTSIKRDSFKIVSGGETVEFRASVYVSRLLFYLIADGPLCTLLEPLDPVGDICPIYTLVHPEEETYSFGLDINSTTDPFSVKGILIETESAGYNRAPQPKEVALVLKDYQSQTLQWMLDQEALEFGLNGCYWETRSFTPGHIFDTAKTWAERLGKPKTKKTLNEGNDNEFFISPILGELRLEKPPLVRGGLLTEEMGMGKTLECVSLIVATQSPEFLERVSKLEPVPWKRDAQFACDATLIVVPPPLIAQWRAEIEKCIKPQHRLRVAVWLHAGDSIGEEFTATTPTAPTTTTNVPRRQPKSPVVVEPDATRMERFRALCLSNDVIITTYRTVDVDVRLLQRPHWRRLILDEMQEIRSATTTIAKSCETLSSHTRWMVSGTPFHSGINDLNGLLNFLGIIPFSLSDSKDGFWGERLKRPLERKDPDALQLLHVLLSDLMMRHSKSQVYVSGPVGESILTLPSARRELVGVKFDTSNERLAYSYLEALGVRAVKKQEQEEAAALAVLALNPMFRPERKPLHERPAFRSFDLCRRFLVSPTMVAGGLGYDGTHRIRDVGEVYRRVLPNDDVHADEDMPHHHVMPSSSHDPNNLTPMPAEKIRDYFLANKSHVDATDGAASDLAMARLGEEEAKIATLRRTISFKLHGTMDGLPKRRWKWVLRVVTSGRALALDLLRRPAMLRGLHTIAPLLTYRALQFLCKVKIYSVAEAVYDRQAMKWSTATPIQLLKALQVPYEREQVQVHTDSFETTGHKIWFRPWILAKELEASDANIKPEIIDKLIGLETQRLQNLEKQTSETATHAKYRSPTDWPPIDLNDQHDFWVKTLSQVVVVLDPILSQLRVNKDVSMLDLKRQTHPGSSVISPTVHFGQSQGPSIVYVSLYWFTATGDRKRAWFMATPVCRVSSDGYRVRFKDGEEMVVSKSRLRFKGEYDSGGDGDVVPQLVEESLDGGGATTTTLTATTCTLNDLIVQKLRLGEENTTHILAAFTQHKIETPTQAAELEEEELARCLETVDEAKAVGGGGSDNKKLAATMGRAQRFLHAWNKLLEARLLADVEGKEEKLREALVAKSKLDFTSVREAVADVVAPWLKEDSFANSTLWKRLWGEDPTWTMEECTRILKIKGDGMTEALLTTQETRQRLACWLVMELLTREALQAVAMEVKRESKEFAKARRAELRKLEREIGEEKGTVFSILSKRCAAVSARLKCGKVISKPVWDLMMHGMNVHNSNNKEIVQFIVQQAMKCMKNCVVTPLNQVVVPIPINGIVTMCKASVGEYNAEALLCGAEPTPITVNLTNGNSMKMDMSELSLLSRKSAAVVAAGGGGGGHDDVDDVGGDDGDDNDDHDDKDNTATAAAMAGYKELPGNLVRVRWSTNATDMMVDAHKRVEDMVKEITRAIDELPDKEAYQKLLLRSIERGGQSVSLEALENAGFKALEFYADGDIGVAPVCGVCYDELRPKDLPLRDDTPVMTPCLHSFCRRCIVTVKNADKHHMLVWGQGASFRCPQCRQNLKLARCYAVLPPTPAPIVHMDVIEESTATSTTTTTTTTEERTDVIWTPGYDLDTVLQKTTQLPTGLQHWDDYCFLAKGLPKQFRTLLRLAADVPVLGAKANMIPNTYGAKIRRILQDVKNVTGKVVIFSQFAETIDTLMQVFALNDVDAVRVTRGEKSRDLAIAVERFNVDPQVKCICLHVSVAAAGLTLTSARYVFLTEPFANAADEAQAINRVHRIGQTQSVVSRCYYVRDSVEERILAFRGIESGIIASTDGSELTVLQGEDDSKNNVKKEVLQLPFLRYVLGVASDKGAHEE